MSALRVGVARMEAPQKAEGAGEVSPEASSSSLKEPFVGNVSKFIPLPAETDRGSSVKKGLLQFDACFEGGWLPMATVSFFNFCCEKLGNLGRVDYINDFEYDLFIRPDTCNPK